MLDRVAVARAALFVAVPPSRKRPPIRKLEIPPGDRPYSFWFLNSHITGVLIHWDPDEKRTYPCNGSACWFDHNHGLPRWQGWIGIQGTDMRVRMFCATPGLVQSMPELIDPAVNLRGRSFTVWRHGKSQHGALMGKWTDGDPRPSQLAHAPDVNWNLQRLWTAETPIGE